MFLIRKIASHLLVACALLAGRASLRGAEAKLSETRTTLEKWVETRQLIAKTRADWQADKETLNQTAQLFERELANIQEQMGKISTNNSQVDKERAQASELLKTANEGLDWVRGFATQFEERLGQFIPRLPTPLQEIVKPLQIRIPSKSAQAKISAAERVQVIIGILNEIDKFNGAVTIFNEKRKNLKGEDVAVDCVYIGLGAGFFVNSTGDLSGVGTPGPSGWEWKIQNELASSVQEVIRIYRNEQTARFVLLPVTIQ